jgi:hypothetical protein
LWLGPGLLDRGRALLLLALFPTLGLLLAVVAAALPGALLPFAAIILGRVLCRALAARPLFTATAAPTAAILAALGIGRGDATQHRRGHQARQHHFPQHRLGLRRACRPSCLPFYAGRDVERLNLSVSHLKESSPLRWTYDPGRSTTRAGR